jgi:hypothetical protein
MYTYKTDKHGKFVKIKARLIVQGDQQHIRQDEETYATTLAGKLFRTLIAIAARFQLQMLQFDVVNAFVHAKLNRPIFMKMPPGHAQRNKILLLYRALYELRISPILWQQQFTAILTKIGYT